MVVLAWICALLFALCGAGLVVAGLSTSGGALVVLVILGVVVGCGSVPFVRSARRMRKALKAEPLDDTARSSRRHKTWAILSYCAVSAASALFLPLPGVVRAVGVITSVLVAPLLLMSEFDKPKRR